MQWLVPAVTISLITALLLSSFFYLLWYSYHDIYLKYWFISSVFNLLRYSILIINLNYMTSPFLDAVRYLFIILNGYSLTLGVLHYLQIQVKNEYHLVTVLVSIWAITAVVFNVSWFWTVFVIFTYMALLFVISGYFMITWEQNNVGQKLLGAIVIIWGLHKGDFPFLRPVEWFAPIGYLIAAVLEVSVMIGFMLLFYEDLNNRFAVTSKKYETLFNKNTDAVCITDNDFNILEVNTSFLELFEIQSEEHMVNYNIKEFFLNPNDSNIIVEEMNDSQVIMKNREFRMTTRRNNIIDVLISCSSFEEPNIAIGYQISIRDITYYKYLERQMEVTQRLESLGVLAAGITHDFNNLLMGVSGYVNLIQESDDISKHMEYAKSINSIVDRTSSLINELKMFSKTSSHKDEVLDLYNVVEDILIIIERTTDKLITKKIDITQGKHFVKISRTELNQILINLITNAIAAIEKSKGDKNYIKLSAKNEYVNDDPTIPKDVKFVHIIIKDTGIGISDSIREKIFDPFFTTKQNHKTQGLGLGLSIVFKIVENHNGYIRVSSEKGKGATFHIYLPYANPKDIIPSEMKKESIKNSQQETTCKTILIVEDDVDILDSIRKYLENNGFEVHYATDGEQAIETFSAHYNNIDIVLLDLILPKKSGNTVLEKFFEIDPKISVIIGSGYGENQIDNELRSRVMGYLKKPYELKELVELINSNE